MANLRVLLSGGGSGGHVFPAFAVADALRQLVDEQGDSVEFRFAGTADGIESELAVEADMPYSTIAARALRGRNFLSKLLSVGATATGVLDALALMLRYQPHLVFVTGGYVSAPVGSRPGSPDARSSCCSRISSLDGLSARWRRSPAEFA